MTIVATTYVTGATTRFTFYRPSGLPSTAKVVQQHRDGNIISTHNVTFAQQGKGAIFDIKVVGDCVVTLNTGETKLFEFDAAASTVDKYSKYDSDLLDNTYDSDTTDPYDSSDLNGNEFLSSLEPPLYVYRSSSSINVAIPYIPKGQVAVEVYDRDGNKMVNYAGPYFWTMNSYITHNGIIASYINIPVYDYSSNSESKNLKEGSGNYYSITVGKNPISDKELRVFNHDGLYGKTYGEKV